MLNNQEEDELAPAVGIINAICLTGGAALFLGVLWIIVSVVFSIG